MRKWFFICCFVLAPAAALAADAKKECCFTNVAYSGVCQVTPGDGETCTSILQYLNSPNSAGKNYCTNTNVRGGWKKKTCEGKKKEGTADGQRSPEGGPVSSTPAPPASGH